MSNKNTVSPEFTQWLCQAAATALASCAVADNAELSDNAAAYELRAIAQNDCEEFFGLADTQLTCEQDEHLTKLCLHGTPQECIQHTLSVLNIAKV